MSSHLGAELAALVDGELDHAARERVLRHLTRCDGCRAEVEAQRRFKSELRALGQGPLPPDAALRARLQQVAAGPGAGSGPPSWQGPRRPGDGRPGTGSRRRLPRRTVGGVVLVLGLGAVFVLGGPPREAPRTRVDPTSDAFLVDFAGTSGELPLSEPVGAGLPGPGR